MSRRARVGLAKVEEHLGKGDGLWNWDHVDLDGVLDHLDVGDGDELEE